MQGMSRVESKFISWLLGIAGSLSVIILVGAFTFYVSAEKFKSTDEADDNAMSDRVTYVEQRHKVDVDNIGVQLELIRIAQARSATSQAELLKTQKEILSRLPNR